MNKPYKPHWKNPWEGDVIYVPIEELAECDYGLGKQCGFPDGSSQILTKEMILEHWRTRGDKLDAYVLPQPSGFHDMGIRYGNEGSEYLSPLGDSRKLEALIKKYQKPVTPTVMYTAVLFAQNGNGETFCYSQPVSDIQKLKVLDLLAAKAGIRDYSQIETITILRNGKVCPEMVKHWSRQNGDF